MDDDEDAVPAEAGFWCGLECGREGINPVPPNPYPLRTEERTAWSRGYALGCDLGRSQRGLAKQVAAMVHKFPDGGSIYE